MDAETRDKPGSGPSGDDSPDARGALAVRKAAGGDELNREEERYALDFLLGTPTAAEYEVTVQYETDAGMLPLTFHFRAMDGRKLDKIEQKHISEKTGMMDKAAADAELIFEATTKLVDKAGNEVKLDSEQFRTLKPGEPPLASGIDALYARLGTQPGLLAGVARAIREAAGWDSDRVGKASRVMVDAAGN